MEKFLEECYYALVLKIVFNVERISITCRRNTLKKTSVIIIALIMLITLTGITTADQGVAATPSTAGITSQVSIDCEGTVMMSSSLGWTVSDSGIAARGGSGSYDGWGSMLDPGQTQYSTTYDSSTIAQNGHTTYMKTMAIGTGNKLLTQSNVKADTSVTFVATGDGGNILGSENIMIDGAGMPTSAGDRMLCPFGAAGGNVIPAYCNIAMAGSRYDLTIGSVVTSANNRFIGTDATAPVALNYAINVKPYTIIGSGTYPAMGSVSSYYKVSIKEGRTGYIGNVSALAAQGRLYTTGNGALPYMDNSNGAHVDGVYHPNIQPLNWNDVGLLIASGNMSGVGIGPKNEDLTYTETSTASGIINSYSAAYQYISGPSS